MSDTPAIEKQKTVSGLESVLEAADGQAMKTDTGAPVTVKRAMLMMLGGHRCEAAGTFHVYELAVRLRACNGSIDLSEADHAFLKDIVEKAWNTSPMGAYAMAQVYRAVS